MNVATPQDFAFTRDMLQWIRRHASVLNRDDMAQHIRCAPGSLENICRKFGIVLCRESDPHADLAPVPARGPLRPAPHGERRLSAPPKVHPRLRPELRPAQMLADMNLKIGRDAIAFIDREAARRRTTPAVLAAIVLEIVATENLFAAVLNLED